MTLQCCENDRLHELLELSELKDTLLTLHIAIGTPTLKPTDAIATGRELTNTLEVS